LGKNKKLSPKWSGPHEIISLEGTHNVELLVNNKKKVIVNVDRIKPYCLPPVNLDYSTNQENISLKEHLQPQTTEEKEGSSTAVPLSPDSINSPQVLKNPKDSPPTDITVPEPLGDTEAPFITVTRKRGRPRKVSPVRNQPATITLTAPTTRKEKWNLPPPVTSASSVMTRSQTKKAVLGALSAINTKVPRNTKDPCFCGNQRLLKYHSSNCKQQMLNWVLTNIHILPWMTGLKNPNTLTISQQKKKMYLTLHMTKQDTGVDQILIPTNCKKRKKKKPSSSFQTCQIQTH
jgi:hypothetical protein